jgi:hypothetical protein
MKIFLFLFFYVSLSIQAKEFSYYIEWKEVKGAKGYLFQLQDLQNQLEKEERIQDSSIELKLQAGKYKFRIASVNKFGKASSWTNWETFVVEKDKPKTTTEVQNRMEDKKMNIPIWKLFVPGLVQYETKKWQSYTYWLVGLTFGLYIYTEGQKANSLSEKNLNQSIYLSSITLNTPVQVDILLYLNRENDRTEYNRHIQNQQQASIVLLLGYIFQIYQAKKIRDTLAVSLYMKSYQERLTQNWNDLNLNHEFGFTWRF